MFLILAEEVKAEEKLTVILRSLSQIAFVTSSTRESIDSVVKQVYPSPRLTTTSLPISFVYAHFDS